MQDNGQNIPGSTEPIAQGRLQDRQPVAVVDIGSNSVRLVIYEGNCRSLTVLFNEKVLSGLGKGLARTNRLDPKAVDSALAALSRFRRLAAQANVREIHPIATAAAREAQNGPDFIAAAEAAIGCEIVILSGKDEARYAAEGVLSGPATPPHEERIARADPDVIVIAYMDRRRFPADDIEKKLEFLRTDTVASQMTAVREDRIVQMDAHAMSATMRSIYGLETLSEALSKMSFE